MRLYFYGIDQMVENRNVDNMAIAVQKATGHLTDGKWQANMNPVYIEIDGFSKEDIAKIMEATKHFEGDRVIQ